MAFLSRHAGVLASARPASPRGAEVSFETAKKNLSSLCDLLSRSYRARFQSPRFSDVKEMKQFCSGLLDQKNFENLKNGTLSPDHPWSGPLSTLTPSRRVSVAGTLFLFRKCLPSDIPSVDSYIKEMCTESPKPDPNFLTFARGEIDRLFPSGWDRGYSKRIDRVTLPLSACLESKRDRGGARAVLLDEEKKIERKEFCDYMRGAVRPKGFVRPDGVRAVLAACDGKTRVVTKNTVWMQTLSAFHDTFYDFLSTKKFLLRGEATTDRFLDFSSVEGEVFVSGDYEGATNNLNWFVQNEILNLVSERCLHVPSDILLSAKSTLNCGFYDEKGHLIDVQRRGQLMGNLLSFPLLCLVNYLAFKYFVRRDVPVRINGDDIVFRAKPEEVEQWKRGIESTGLVLSEGKTVIDSRFFSLNSTFFRSSPSLVSSIPVVRSTQWFKPLEDASAVADRLSALSRSVPSHARAWLQGSFIRRHFRQLVGFRGSLTRRMGCSVSPKAMSISGWTKRESFYLSLPEEPDLPRVPVGYLYQRVPAGWRRVVTSDSSQDSAFHDALTDAAWCPEKNVVGDTFDSRVNTFRYVHVSDRSISRLARLFGRAGFSQRMGFVEARRRLALTKIKKQKKKNKQEKHWRFVEEASAPTEQLRGWGESPALVVLRYDSVQYQQFLLG